MNLLKEYFSKKAELVSLEQRLSRKALGFF